MNQPVAPSANPDSASFVKPTRWHVPPERMRLTRGASAALLADALQDPAAVIPPDRIEPVGDLVQAREMLKAADPRLLLMALVHLTGDAALLDRVGAYIPAQVAGGAKGVAGLALPDAMQAELRDRILEILAQDPRPPEAAISAALFQKMASVCAGDPVRDEAVPMVLEQAGFTTVQGVDPAARAKPRTGQKVLIVGAGLTGIALGVQLGEQGYDYEIIERNPEVGGTWWINRYPGVGVDTPSHYYSYSFDINPDWPKYFSPGSVLIEYLQRAATRFGVRERIRFETEALSARFDEADGRWTVRVRDAGGAEREIVADIFVPAINFTVAPSIPPIPGLARFKGPAMHTAQWDEGLDLTGKRVAVIGTGASSMQVCTTIAPQVAQMTIFQRSRHWIVPAPLVGVAVPDGVRWAMRHVPHYAQWQRFMAFWTSADNIYPAAVMDPDWTMKDVSVSATNERRRQLLLAYIASELEGRPDLIAKVTPDYPPMGKRIILDAGWYKMLRRDNVELDEIGIAEVTEDAIVTRDGRRVPVDVIVLSTGFSMRPMLPSLEITGRNGLTLTEAWGDNPRAYLGMLVPEFPNMFVMNGPNSVPTHGAGQNLTAETSAAYVLGLLDLMATENAGRVECKPEALEAYNAAVDEQLSRMVWSHPKASSYYLNAQRRNTMSCPWRLVDVWWMTRRPDPQDLILTPRGG
jgi:4-hydroxyacetophenone monooxygenase